MTFLVSVNTQHLVSSTRFRVLGSTELKNESSFQHEREVMNGDAFVFIVHIKEALNLLESLL